MKIAYKVINNILYGKLKHISRFSLVGVSNTIIDFLMFTILHGVFGVNYIVSQVLGYSFGVINSFLFNKKWTFNDNNSSKRTVYELIQFVIVNLISLVVTVIAMKFLVKNFNINVYISKIIVTFIAQIVNFICYKFWVFK